MNRKLSVAGGIALCSLIVILAIIFVWGNTSMYSEELDLPGDIEESYAKDAIIALCSDGVLTTYNIDGHAMFFPQKEVTREYLARSIITFLGINTKKYKNADIGIADTSMISSECLPYVKTAVVLGIMDIYEYEGVRYFLPAEKVTREEAAYTLGDLSSASMSSSKTDLFSDFTDVSETCALNMAKLVGYDILIGYPDGTLLPKNVLTHEELAIILYRISSCEDFNLTL